MKRYKHCLCKSTNSRQPCQRTCAHAQGRADTLTWVGDAHLRDGGQRARPLHLDGHLLARLPQPRAVHLPRARPRSAPAARTTPGCISRRPLRPYTPRPRLFHPWPQTGPALACSHNQLVASKLVFELDRHHHAPHSSLGWSFAWRAAILQDHATLMHLQ